MFPDDASQTVGALGQGGGDGDAVDFARLPRDARLHPLPTEDLGLKVEDRDREPLPLQGGGQIEQAQGRHGGANLAPDIALADQPGGIDQATTHDPFIRS